MTDTPEKLKAVREAWLKATSHDGISIAAHGDEAASVWNVLCGSMTSLDTLIAEQEKGTPKEEIMSKTYKKLRWRRFFNRRWDGRQKVGRCVHGAMGR